MLGYIFFYFQDALSQCFWSAMDLVTNLKNFLAPTIVYHKQLNEVAPVTFTANTVSLIYYNIWKDVLSFG